jgi:hypothetical protein
MKYNKIAKLAMLAFGCFAFTACVDDINDPVPAPTVNAQDSLQSANFTIAQGDSTGVVFTEDADTTHFNLITISNQPTYSSTASVAYVLQMSANKDFTSPTAVTATINKSNKFEVNRQTFNNQVMDIYGKRIQKDSLYFRTIIKITDGGTVSEIISNTYGPMYVTPYIAIGEFLYVPGNAQVPYVYKSDGITPYNWNPATAAVIYSAKNDMNYNGYVYLDGDFKFTSQADWNHINFGQTDGKISTNSDASNLNATAGMYNLSVNLNNYTYTLTAISSFSIIGSVYGNWDADLDMAYNIATNCYSVTADLTAGEFKFRASHAWTYSFGTVAGSTDALTDANGNNIALANAGNYTIKFYPSYNGKSYCTITKN